MSILLLISIILGVSFQNIIKKPYSIKAGGKGVYFFCLLTSLAAMLFFAVTAGRFEWDPGIVPYAFLFAVSYATASIFSLEAVSCGPLSLSSLVISYSLLLPTLYGLIFLKEPIRPALIPGLVLLVVSLFLINQKNDSAPITFKWIIFVVLAFFGNGICTIAQNMQQREFDGAHKNEFMIIALAIVALILLFFVIVKERKDIHLVAKVGWLPAIACGIVNGAVNLFVMMLSARMAVSIMFPLISAGGIIITYVVSKFVYKETLTKLQFAGFITGIVSIVLLNI
jgi:drug/metabolite transporter (DMT)-like permease